MPRISRRTFFILSGLAAGRALAQEGERKELPPNERINLGIIGSGAQGRYDARAMYHHGHEIVAICDVDSREADRLAKVHPGAKRHTDYRRMFDNQLDIDAVVVATPDHHHYLASLEALQRKIPVYCEKPLTHSVWEARDLARAAAEAGVATQMGNTGQASDAARTIAEYLAAGAIGPVREVHVWTNRPIWPQGIDRPDPQDVPPELDWDAWLGPAPERPFNEIYHPFRWRGWWDFGTGALGDIGCHRLHPVFKALHLKHPSTVEATSTNVNGETFPHASIVRYEFPARGDWPALKLTWYDGGLLPPRPDELEPDRQLSDDGLLYIGDNGTMLDGRIIPDSRGKDIPKPAETLPRSPGHREEWYRAIKSGPEPGAAFSFAGPLTEVVLLGNIVLKTPKKLEWDPVAFEFTNAPEMTAHLRREYRPGWSV